MILNVILSCKIQKKKEEKGRAGDRMNISKSNLVLILGFQSGQMAPFACLPVLLGIKQQFCTSMQLSHKKAIH